ncbi:chemotaxis protein CheW [Propionispora hippei]|uniref:Chemotaxis protein CheW n=1 Tax=Propionispora hippei DSM 15287 TaxID=1123003 RepID=A0A1M6IVR4_9FIRM|nr:chemotaxis protein CheW [Propionispora hippei]SHJ38522.1 purine-binding chemotaxis protein CheW [Propionispora hippei DSM 15287]
MAQVAEEMIIAEEDTQKGKFLTFSLGQEEYGIEIRHVIEIIGMQVITEVPELPAYIKGIINLRGKIIPVMDVRLRFKKEPREYNDRTCVVVIEISEVAIGLIVDTVLEVLVIQDENIIPPPEIGKAFHNKYIKGIGKVGNAVKLLLNCERLISDEETAVLSDM